MIKNIIQAIINLFGCRNKPKVLDTTPLSSCKQTGSSSKKPKKTTRKKNSSKNNK